MPIYVFEDEKTGETVEEHFSMADAPKIGDTVEIGGRTLRRVFSGNLDAGLERKTHGYPYASHSLPPDIPGCDHTPDRRPIIRSRKHENEVMAKTGWVRE